MGVEIPTVDTEEIECAALRNLVELLHPQTTLRELEFDELKSIFLRLKRIVDEGGTFRGWTEFRFVEEETRTLAELFEDLCQ